MFINEDAKIQMCVCVHGWVEANLGTSLWAGETSLGSSLKTDVHGVKYQPRDSNALQRCKDLAGDLRSAGTLGRLCKSSLTCLIMDETKMGFDL